MPRLVWLIPLISHTYLRLLYWFHLLVFFLLKIFEISQCKFLTWIGWHSQIWRRGRYIYRRSILRCRRWVSRGISNHSRSWLHRNWPGTSWWCLWSWCVLSCKCWPIDTCWSGWWQFGSWWKVARSITWWSGRGTVRFRRNGWSLTWHWYWTTLR